jgi:hypothetical protein
MKDLYHAIDALNNIIKEAPPRGRQDGPGTRQGTPQTPKPAAPKPAPAAPRPAAVSPTPGVGRQDGPGLPKPAAPKINPAVPAAGPVRANPINPQAMAATKAAASVVNAPKMAMPTPKPAAPAPRAKVKATAANTKDYDKIVALQKKLGVTADGIMGPQTRAAMAAAAAKKPATPASQVTPTAGDPGMQKAPAMGTARKASTVAPGAAPAQDAQATRVAKSNAALAGDVEKVKKAGSGILDKIGAGLSNIFKPSTRSVRGRRQAAAQAAPAAGSNAAGSNFATAADGSISRTDNPRQPSDAAPTTRTAAATGAAPTRRSDTSFKASDGTNAVARDASGNLNVRQRVTDPAAKAALVSKVNRAREMQRLALAAGSTDPDDIRAYQRRMANTRGTGASGGTDMNTF